MSWTQVLNQPGNFPMCGAFYGGKLYFGGYGSGDIYSNPPFSTEVSNSGESILDMQVFKGALYATRENNSHRGSGPYVTGLFVTHGGGGWSEVNVDGSASFFMCGDDNALYFTSASSDPSGHPDQGIDLWASNDGATFGRMASFDDWLWVPFLYNGNLYVAGANGHYSATNSKVVRSTAGGFVTVDALTGLDGEPQCFAEFNGNLYCGFGGWLNDRGTPGKAKIIKFDGSIATTVLIDATYSEISALAVYGNRLYATASSGFKWDSSYGTPETSRVYYTTDGTTWTEDTQVFPAAQMRVLIPTTAGLILAGGSNSGVIVYNSGDAMIPIPANEPAAPTNVAASLISNSSIPGDDSILISWIASTYLAGATEYSIQGTVSPFEDYYVENNWARILEVGVVPVSGSCQFIFQPTQYGHYRFRVRVGPYSFIVPPPGGGFHIPSGSPAPGGSGDGNFRPGVQEEFDVFNSAASDEWAPVAVSAWSAYSNVVTYPVNRYTLATPPAPTSMLSVLTEIDVTFVTSATPTASSLIAVYNTTGIVVGRGATLPNGTTSWSLTPVTPGETYWFTVQYWIAGTNIYSPISARSQGLLVPGSLVAPADVTASFITASSVRIDWTDASYGESLYEVWRYMPTGGWVKLAEVGRNVTEFVDSSISIAAMAAYGVVARSGNVVSARADTAYVPLALSNSLVLQLDGYDTATEQATLSFNIENWVKYNSWPFSLTVEASSDGTLFYATQTLLVDAIVSPVTIPVEAGRIIYARLIATNGAGSVVSNVVTVSSVPALFTVANPPMYYAGSSLGRGLVIAPDGVGETDFSITGLARYAGYLYASMIDSIGTLDKDITYAEITTQPIGREWYGGKTIYSVDVDGTSPKELTVRVDTLRDYKSRYERGREVTLHKSGRTGYIQYGEEFVVVIKFQSGVPKDLHLSGARAWLKLSDRRGLNTIPLFFGKHGVRTSQVT